MHRLALRLLRPYLLVAAVLSALATAFVLVAARVVGQQAGAHGIVVEDYAPDRTGVCEAGVSCLPTGLATTLTQAITLVAVFVPPLIGLILGVPLFAREREESTDAFVLTQSVSRSRWFLTKLLWALAGGALCAAATAVAFCLTAARYALIVDGPGFSWLRIAHGTSIPLMVTQTVFLTAMAGVLGLAGGRTLRTVAIAVAAWPVVIVAARIGGLMLGGLAFMLTSWSESMSQMLGTQTEDEVSAFSALAYSAGTAVAVLAGRRILVRGGPRE